MRRTVRAGAAAVLVGAGLVGIAATLVRAGAVVLSGVSPSHGPSDQATGITLSGDGFAPGARVALLNGGPFLLGSYIMPEGARAVEITGGRACVAFYSHATKLGGILILDLTDPAALSPVGAFETGDSGTGVQVAGSLAYVPFLNPYTYEGGLHIVDITIPAEPRRLGTVYGLVDPQAINVAGTYAYVADGAAGLKIIDVSDPSSPRLAGVFDTGGTARDVKIAGAHAYVADGAGGLVVVDVTDPAAPGLAGSYATPASSITGVALQGTRAYAADIAAGLLVLDVTDPARPVLLGRAPTSDAATSVAVDGRYAFVAGGGRRASGGGAGGPGDPAPPASPIPAAPLRGTAPSAADIGAGLRVLVVPARARRVLRGRAPPSDAAPRVGGEGRYAFGGEGVRGLEGGDVSAPVPPSATK